MKKIFPFLTYAGALPFIICTMYLYMDIYKIPILGPVKSVLSIYGLVITSFLAGAHWGQHLNVHKEQWQYFLSIVSNIIAVMLWFSFLVLSFKMLMGMFVVAFIVLLIIDYWLYLENVITRYYFQTRLFVSVIVIISLTISGIVS